MENRNKTQPKAGSLKDLQINQLRAGLIEREKEEGGGKERFNKTKQEKNKRKKNRKR